MPLCNYGCGQEAIHQFKNGKWCCSKDKNSCLVFKNKKYFSDLTNKRFGRWIVLYRSSKKDKSGNFYWWCTCDCGNKKEVRGNSLVSRKSISCGCFNKEQTIKTHKIEEGLAAKRVIYRTYLRNAKKRNLIFELSFEQFLNLSQQSCYYCGDGPSNFSKDNGNGGFKYNGIDRVDNVKGYNVENSVSCCDQCNWAKRDLSIKEFIKWIEKVFILSRDKNAS